MTDYEKYQLQWMIEHNHSLSELINELKKVQYADPEDSDVTSAPITEIFEAWEQNSGFGGEVWACEEEYQSCEGNSAQEAEIIGAPFPWGTICAEPLGDPNYPGCALFVRRKDGTNLDVAVLEYSIEGEELHCLVWGDSESEDYTNKFIFPEKAYRDNRSLQAVEVQPKHRYDLGYGHMGNGLTVWNRMETENGDYKTIAHIDTERKVTFYDAGIPEESKAQILKVAETSDMSISATQDAPVFTTPPQMSQNEAGGNDLWQEYSRIRSEHNGAIVFYQVGDFYEVLGADAEIVSKALDIRMTTRNVGLKERVPMCGVPVISIDTPINLLHDRGYDLVLVDDKREIYPLPADHAQPPAETRPVGRIDYLRTNGEVGCSTEYTDAERFVRDMLDDNHCGVPMSIVVYRDKDGNTIPTDFVYRFDPLPQGYEIIDYEKVRPETSLDRAKKLIDEYCEREFGHGGDYENLAHVDIGYTEVEDEEVPVQIVADLINCRIDRYLGKQLVDQREYDSIEDLISAELEHLDFSDLIDFTEDQLETARISFLGLRKD